MSEVQERLEYAVVGFAVAYPDQFYELENLTPEHFTHPTAKRVFKAMLRVWREHGAPGLEASALVGKHLVNEGIAQDEAFSLLVECKDFAPASAAGVIAVRRELETHLARRSLSGVAHSIGELAQDQRKDCDELLSEAMALVTDTARHGSRAEVHTLAEAMQAEIDRMESDAVEIGGASTGLNALDHQLGGGFRGGELIIVGGRPGMGKSSLLNHFAYALAGEQEIPGVVFSLEMRAEEYAQRLICNRSMADLQLARTKALDPFFRAAYIDAAKELERVPMMIVDQGGISLPMLTTTARRLYHEQKIGWVGVDYLQLIDHKQGRNESTNDAITRTSKDLKALALSLDIPVIVLSQLNRDCEKRDNKRPRLSDLRSSGSIEQDADVVVFIYRGAVYYTPEEVEDHRKDTCDEVELIIAKQRNGPVGTVTVDWRRGCARFCDAEF